MPLLLNYELCRLGGGDGWMIVGDRHEHTLCWLVGRGIDGNPLSIGQTIAG